MSRQELSGGGGCRRPLPVLRRCSGGRRWLDSCRGEGEPESPGEEALGGPGPRQASRKKTCELLIRKLS